MMKTETTTIEAEQVIDQCPTCTRSKYDPFRQYVDGKIVAGCVDDYHTGHLVSISATNSWHYSKQAKEIRATAAKHKRNILKSSKPCDCRICVKNRG